MKTVSAATDVLLSALCLVGEKQFGMHAHSRRDLNAYRLGVSRTFMLVWTGFAEWYPSAIKARKIVCFISADYLRSPYCMKEWRVAESKGKLLVRLHTRHSVLRAVLQSTQRWSDWHVLTAAPLAGFDLRLPVCLQVVACEPIPNIMAVDPSAFPHASNALAYLDGGGQVIFHGKVRTCRPC